MLQFLTELGARFQMVFASSTHELFSMFEKAEQISVPFVTLLVTISSFGIGFGKTSGFAYFNFYFLTFLIALNIRCFQVKTQLSKMLCLLKNTVLK